MVTDGKGQSRFTAGLLVCASNNNSGFTYAAALLMGFLPSSGLTQLSYGSESEKKSLVTQVNESKRAPLTAFVADLRTYYGGDEAVVLSINNGDGPG